MLDLGLLDLPVADQFHQIGKHVLNVKGLLIHDADRLIKRRVDIHFLFHKTHKSVDSRDRLADLMQKPGAQSRDRPFFPAIHQFDLGRFKLHDRGFQLHILFFQGTVKPDILDKKPGQKQPKE